MLPKRRYLCPGCRKTYIRKGYPKGTFSYQDTKNRCRKCARTMRLQADRIAYQERKRA